MATFCFLSYVSFLGVGLVVSQPPVCWKESERMALLKITLIFLFSMVWLLPIEAFLKLTESGYASYTPNDTLQWVIKCLSSIPLWIFVKDMIWYLLGKDEREEKESL